MRFFKICSAGNDYLYLFKPDKQIDYAALSKKVSDRHFGIGSDGLIVLENFSDCDCSVIMYNSDGSRGKICGNGIRGAAFLLSARQKKLEYVLNTDCGKIRLKTLFRNDERGVFTADMGNMTVVGEKKIVFGGREYDVCFSDAGNLHAVVFCDKPQKLINQAVKFIKQENLSDYNVEFVKIENDGNLTVYVHERGSGRTLSCGSGACAVYKCALQKGYVSGETSLLFEGGKMLVKEENGHILLTGSSVYVCEAEYGDEV